MANFRAAGYDSTRATLFIDPQGRHTEDSWAARFPAALEFLYGGWQAPPQPRAP